MRLNGAVRLQKPLLLLVVLYLMLFGALAFTRDQLPERVATHFGTGGIANGWMMRDHFLWGTAAFSLVLPAAVVGLCYVIRQLPVSMLNLPNREYWIAPERRQATYDFIFSRSLWFASIAVGFVTGIYFMILEANKHTTPQLSEETLLAFTGVFLAAMLVWVWRLIAPFTKMPGAEVEKELV